MSSPMNTPAPCSTRAIMLVPDRATPDTISVRVPDLPMPPPWLPWKLMRPLFCRSIIGQ